MWWRRPDFLKAGLGALCLCFLCATYFTIQWLPANAPSKHAVREGRSARRAYLAKDIIRVMMIAENERLGGTIAAVNSVIKNTRSPVHFYFVTDNSTAHHLWSWIESSVLKNISYEIKVFDESQIPRQPNNEIERPLMYAKLFLENFIPNGTVRVVCLDDDVIVQGDIRELANVKIRKGDVGAFSKDCDVISKHANRYGNRYGNYINVKNEHIVPLNINATSCIFNIGVFVVDMVRWRQLGVTKTTVKLMELNLKHPVYHGDGPLPPMLITLYGKITPLDPKWHVRHLGFTRGAHYSKKFLKNAKLYHWDGNFKPWGHRPPHGHIWSKYYVPDPKGRFLTFANMLKS